MLSGSPEGMKSITEQGKLDEWYEDNINWLKQTFGKENLVSAVLHLDEKTPHIHATVVPIVTGERRKAKLEKPEDSKKKYKKKNANNARLCTDDVMAWDKLKTYQDTYAQAMGKFGLQRGQEGSEAKHISTQQYYRDLYLKNEDLKKDNSILEVQKTTEQKELNKLKSQANTERIKESIGDLFTGSKTKRLEQENAELKTKVQSLETQLSKEKIVKQQIIKTYETKIEEKQKIIDKIFDYFPEIKEKLFIIRLCEKIRLGANLIKELLAGKRMIVSGNLYSPEHNQSFKADQSQMMIDENPKEKGKLRLNIDSLDIYDWFRTKKQEFLKGIGISIKRGKGMGL
ncbi:mobilization protein [Bacteroidia bacterium]|nr:mobilization protein [Bacteroidia bacterium]